MAAKKKPTTTAPAEANQPESGIPEETAKAISEQESQEQTQEPEQESQEQTQEQIGDDTPCPFEATVSVALAVLRKVSGLGTAEMLKPVATLKQGTKVTVVAMKDGSCMLRNGLWTASEYLTK